MGEYSMKKLDRIRKDLENESVWFIIYKYLLWIPSMYLRMLLGILARLSFIPGIIYPQHVISDNEVVEVNVQVGFFYTEIRINDTSILVQRFNGKVERIFVGKDDQNSSSQ